MDYDEAFNISTFNSTNDLPPSISMGYLSREILFTIFFVIGICADIVIIYTIFRFRRMRTVPYIFLGNWAIADLCCLLVTPSVYRIISVIDQLPIPHAFLCVLEEAGMMFHVTVLLFVIVVLLDWFIAAYFGRASEKFRRRYKLIIGVVWAFSLIWITVFSATCMTLMYRYYHEGFLLVTSYGTIVLFIIVFQSSRLVQKCRKVSVNYPTLMLNLGTVFIINSVLSIIILIFVIEIRYKTLRIIAICFLFSNSLVNLCLLYFFDKNFHACLRQGLKRSTERYEEPISEFNNSTRNIDEAGRVKISFHNSQEQLTNVD